MHEAWYHDPKYWVAISFVLFLGLFVKYLLPKLLDALDARSAAIRAQLEQAANLRKEAEALLVEYKARQDMMLKEAEALVKTTELEVENMKKRAQADLETMMTRRRAQAEANIARMETDARDEIRQMMLDIAEANARQLMVQQLEGMKEDPAVARVIAQIQRSVH